MDAPRSGGDPRGLTAQGLASVEVRSNVADRAEYLRRPDKGRTLHPDGDAVLGEAGQGFDLAIVIADGLSATAVALNAVPTAAALAARAKRAGWNLAPSSSRPRRGWRSAIPWARG